MAEVFYRRAGAAFGEALHPEGHADDVFCAVREEEEGGRVLYVDAHAVAVPR